MPPWRSREYNKKKQFAEGGRNMDHSYKAAALKISKEQKEELIRRAFEVLPDAYAPYSHFHVAAALLCRDGSVYTGCNVENASYPAGICAERSAFSAAVSGRKRQFDAIAIVGGRDGKAEDYCAPCGICRQVMREFVRPDEFVILLAKSPSEYREYTLSQLLPESFGPENLENA